VDDAGISTFENDEEGRGVFGVKEVGVVHSVGSSGTGNGRVALHRRVIDVAERFASCVVSGLRSSSNCDFDLGVG
jgi:hypothetical protein